LASRVSGARPESFSVEYQGMLERGDAIELRSSLEEGSSRDENGSTLTAWLLVDGDVRVSARVRVSHLH
jgi:hypothetical protein